VNLCALVVLAVSCGASNDESVAREDQALIYDADTRSEVAAHGDENWLALSDRHVVALIPKSNLIPGGADSLELTAPSAAELLGVCPDERFADQPVGAACTGVLVAPDVVLTAAHCFDAFTCTDFAYALRYRTDANGALGPLHAADVTECERLLLSALSEMGSAPLLDHALVRLKRPLVPDLEPLARRVTPLQAGESVMLLGTPLGAPIKIDPDASVLSPRTNAGDYFTVRADSFIGNSGSPLFDSERRLVGIAITGSPDFYMESTSDCLEVKHVDSGTEEGAKYFETFSYVETALSACGADCGEPAGTAAAGEADAGCGIANTRPQPGKLLPSVSWLAAMAWLARRRRCSKTGGSGLHVGTLAALTLLLGACQQGTPCRCANDVASGSSAASAARTAPAGDAGFERPPRLQGKYEIACLIAYRENTQTPVAKETQLRIAPGDRKTLTLGPHEFQAMFSSEPSEGASLDLRVGSTAWKYQMDHLHPPLNQFLGGHGFTGLIYVSDPKLGDDLQFYCWLSAPR
jgi:hypothetical protein